jgi:hypothetical protein
MNKPVHDILDYGQTRMQRNVMAPQREGISTHLLGLFFSFDCGLNHAPLGLHRRQGRVLSPNVAD